MSYSYNDSGTGMDKPDIEKQVTRPQCRHVTLQMAKISDEKPWRSIHAVFRSVNNILH